MKIYLRKHRFQSGIYFGTPLPGPTRTVVFISGCREDLEEDPRTLTGRLFREGNEEFFDSLPDEEIIEAEVRIK